ncbi:MAG: hypothetical protein QM640_08045 [Niabella sp.]
MITAAGHLPGPDHPGLTINSYNTLLLTGASSPLTEFLCLTQYFALPTTKVCLYL